MHRPHIKTSPASPKSPSTSICKISHLCHFLASNSSEQRAYHYHFRLWIMCLIILFAASTLIVANELRQKTNSNYGKQRGRATATHILPFLKNYFQPHSGSISRCIMQTKSLCPKQRHPLSYYISNQTLYKISCSSVRM